MTCFAAIAAPICSFAGTRPPNIVFIFSDDHALKAISAYGNALTETPRIDSIAKEGMMFTRSYCTNSICGPSRASILTGMHSHRNGFMRNSGEPFDTAQTTFPKLLQQAGYQTALFGKWHLDSTPTGFDEFEILPDQGNYYNPDFILMDGSRVRRQGYVTDLVTDRAFEWLDKRRAADKPFLLMIQHKAPHRTFAPALRHLDLFKDKEVPEPPTLFDDYANRSRSLKENEMEIGRHFKWAYDLKVRDFNPDKSPNNPCPEYQRMNPEQRAAWDAHFEPLNDRLKADYAAGKLDAKALIRWKYQRYVTNYLSTIRSVDENVGRVLDYLDSHGLRENTIVVYSSDQGFYLGEHGWFDKRWMFEESFAMPFIIRWPGVVKPGERSDRLIQNIDYAPTFLEAAGVPIPARMQGRSLIPLLKGNATDWREALFYAYYEKGEHHVPPHTGVMNDRYKLIRFPETNEWNLMDRQKDPLELHGYQDDPAYAGVLDNMKKLYEEKRSEYLVSPSTIPQPRGKPWMDKHQEKSRQAREGAAGNRLVFIGDDLAQGWDLAGKDAWDKLIAPFGALNLGFAGDLTENVLWRIKNGEWPAALQPKVAVVMIGNGGAGERRPAMETATGIKLIVEDIHDRAPDTHIVLLAVGPHDAVAEQINRLAADPRDKIHWVDLSNVMASPAGSPKLDDAFYQRLAEALLPKLHELGL